MRGIYRGSLSLEVFPEFLLGGPIASPPLETLHDSSSMSGRLKLED